MTDQPRTTGDGRSQETPADSFRRREFVALGAGATATMLAGCAGDGGLPSSDGSDGSDGSETLTGNFRLLISDAPAEIGDFDQLNVTLDEARIFESGEDGDEDSNGGDEEDSEGTDETGTETETANQTGDDHGDEVEGGNDEDDDEVDEEREVDEADRDFTVVALDGATVDLTQVIEDDAIAVFDGEIPAGSYEKIELSVTTVEGIVDGAEVDVKLPSEKLQITNGFEVTPDETVSFVFDINVVKRGPNNGYILKPVISGSGVAGRDVEVNEIDGDDDDDEGEGDADGADGADDGEGDADDGGEESGAGGNQTDTGSGGE